MFCALYVGKAPKCASPNKQVKCYSGTILHDYFDRTSKSNSVRICSQTILVSSAYASALIAKAHFSKACHFGGQDVSFFRKCRSGRLWRSTSIVEPDQLSVATVNMNALDEELRKLSEQDIAVVRQVCKPLLLGDGKSHSDYTEEEDGNCSFSAYDRFYGMQNYSGESGLIQPVNESYLEIEEHDGCRKKGEIICDKGKDDGFISSLADVFDNNLHGNTGDQEDLGDWGQDNTRIACEEHIDGQMLNCNQDHAEVSYDKLCNEIDGTEVAPNQIGSFQLATDSGCMLSDQCSISLNLKENIRAVDASDLSCVGSDSLVEVSNRFPVPLEFPVERVCRISSSSKIIGSSL